MMSSSTAASHLPLSANHPTSGSDRLPVTFWSAAPTPLTATKAVDVAAVQRMIDWHVAHEIAGVMVLGTCGEGPWLPDSQRKVLIREAARTANGRIAVAAQVSDNSPARVLEQIEAAASAGAGYAVVAQPYFAIRSKVPDLAKFYFEIFECSALRIGFYDRGQSANLPVPVDLLADLVQHPKVKFVKDSSSDPARAAIYLGARQLRPDLTVMTGSEFRCLECLNLGYNGLMLGGAIVNARYIHRLIAAWSASDQPAAAAIDREMQEMLRTVYGGPALSSWLWGLKYLLVRLGVFSTVENFLNYEMSSSCRDAIDALVRDPGQQLFRPSTNRVLAPFRHP